MVAPESRVEAASLRTDAASEIVAEAAVSVKAKAALKPLPEAAQEEMKLST